MDNFNGDKKFKNIFYSHILKQCIIRDSSDYLEFIESFTDIDITIDSFPENFVIDDLVKLCAKYNNIDVFDLIINCNFIINDINSCILYSASHNGVYATSILLEKYGVEPDFLTILLKESNYNDCYYKILNYQETLKK